MSRKGVRLIDSGPQPWAVVLRSILIVFDINISRYIIVLNIFLFYIHSYHVIAKNNLNKRE
jgi:uncharacterized protein YhhL (DUF1145 family)